MEDKNPTETYPMRTLRIGDVVQAASMDKPVTILACWLLRPSDVDAYAMWTVLCLLPHNTLHPFAVWTAIDHPERGWSFGEGNYCENIGEAVTRYEGRGGKFSLDEYELDTNA